MAETLAGAEEDNDQYRREFRWTIGEVCVYHTILKEFPEGAYLERIKRVAKLKNWTFDRIIRKFRERGLVETDENRYRALPIGNPDVMRVFEENDDPMDIYFELDRLWANLLEQ